MKKVCRAGCFILALLVLFWPTYLIYLCAEPVILTKFSDTNVRKVYKNLTTYLGRPAPKLNIIQSSIVNAWWDGKEITITTGILQTFQSDDELAEVLGHELGHYALYHMELSDKGIVTKEEDLEDSADRYSIYLMLRAGYNICNAKNWMERTRLTEGDKFSPLDHPSKSYRIWVQSFPKQCGG